MNMDNDRELLELLQVKIWCERSGRNPKDFGQICCQSERNSATNSFAELEKKIRNCRACPLHTTRTKVVVGSGDQKAKLVLVGEAPGRNEDLAGEPFVGRAGKLLTSMLASIEIERHEVYICNVLKCRPPNNRDPSTTEVALCRQHLEDQLREINPRLILALGRVAGSFLIGCNLPLHVMRSNMHYYGTEQIPLLVTFHPSFLLRSPDYKKVAYGDLLRMKKIYLELLKKD